MDTGKTLLSIKKNNLIFISVQPDIPYFHWQTKLYLYQFSKYNIQDYCYCVFGFDYKPSQEIKKLVSKLKTYGRTETIFHKKVFRPWGYYNLIEKGLNWKVKEICVNPKSSLSLQKHNFRSEHWIILEGKATVKIKEIKTILSKNQSTYIPIGAKHRLSNDENTYLKLIEVQCRTYLGEDDIFRFEDNYVRINE